jgi:cytochrome c556
MMNKLFQVAMATVLSFGISMTACANEIDDAIEYREAIMGILKWNVKRMGAMVKGQVPFEAKAFAKRAENLAALSQMPLEGFIPGSDKGDTAAKSEIWKEWDKFKAKMEKFQTESAKLAEVAKTATHLREVAPQFVNTVKQCKACHKRYKE